MILEDDDRMPIGVIQRGEYMKNVPITYFKWLIMVNKDKPSSEIDQVTSGVLDYAEKRVKLLALEGKL